MNKKNTKKDYELLVVEDFTNINEAVRTGELSTEEFEQLFASKSRKEGLMNTEDGKIYLKDYGKPEFFLGASDSGVIMGKSPFKSRYMLQLEKRGEVHTNVMPSKQWLFDLGHEAEPFIGSMGARMLRKQGIDVRYEACENGYINTRWPHVLIHPDGYLVDRVSGTLYCLAEVKSSADMSAHWLNSFARDVVPEDYECQVLVEMQVLSTVLDLDKCCVLVWNKTGEEEGFKQLFVEKNEEYAIEILDAMEEFYEDTVKGISYDDDAVLPEEAAEIYKEVDNSLGYVEIPKKHEKLLKQISDLQEEKASLKEEIAEVEEDIKEIEKQEKLLKAKLYSAIGKAPGGTCKIGNDVYHVDVKRSYSLDADVKRWAEENHPEVWAEIKAQKPLIQTKVTKVSGDPEIESEVV